MLGGLGSKARGPRCLRTLQAGGVTSFLPHRCPDTGQAVRGPLGGGGGAQGTMWGKHGPPQHTHTSIPGWVSPSTWEVLVFAAVEQAGAARNRTGDAVSSLRVCWSRGRPGSPSWAETQRQAEEWKLCMGKGSSGSAGSPERPRAPESSVGTHLARRVP